MSLFYQNSRLQFGQEGEHSDLSQLIETEQGHPCYVYDLKQILRRYRYLKENLFHPERLQIHYALKANANQNILSALKKEGSGIDIVSGGELQLALQAGFEGEDMIFSGVAKTADEITLALDKKVQQINVESPQELIRIGEIAKQKELVAPVAFRMNPDVSPVTHPYITTGMSENKFGMTKEFLPELLSILQKYPQALQLRGLTMHIGSQILQLEVFAEAIQKLLSIYKDLEKKGYPLETLDIGGGVGIQYKDPDGEKDFVAIENYAKLVESSLKDFTGQLLIEPGRILVGRSGVLLCKVEYIKETSTKNFAIVNSGMHHLLRPALYQASHRILPLEQKVSGASKMYDVVGPICESSDFLGHDRIFTELEQGDFLAICDAGAYGFAMASQYNAHNMPKEIII